MRYPWANTLLLVLVAIALVSGFFGLTNGDPDRRWYLWVHAAAGWGIVAVAAWKVAVVRRAFERRAGIDGDRPAFIVMSVFIVVVLATGMLWAFAGRRAVAGFSVLTIHETTAVAAALFLLWHVVAHRTVFRVRRARDRRAFLRLAGAGAAGVAAWQLSLLTQRVLGLPGANRRFTGSYETGSMTGRFPVVSWLDDDPERVDEGGWRLRIGGEVEAAREVTYADLAALASRRRTETIDCTGGWYSRQEWEGVPLWELVLAAGPREGADSVTVRSVTGYERRFSVEEAHAALLATSVGGRTLSHGHGFPARLVVPDHRGFDWVKWVTEVRVNRDGDWRQSPVPLE
jgi:DMSO/TMAO reductase YedYZ molybdopterin-dependent catalytic subunit